MYNIRDTVACISQITSYITVHHISSYFIKFHLISKFSFPRPRLASCAPRTSLPASSLRPWSEPPNLWEFWTFEFTCSSHEFSLNSHWVFNEFSLSSHVLYPLDCSHVKNWCLLFSSVLSLLRCPTWCSTFTFIYINDWCTFHNAYPTNKHVCKLYASRHASQGVSHISLTCIVWNAASSPTKSHKCQRLNSIDWLTAIVNTPIFSCIDWLANRSWLVIVKLNAQLALTLHWLMSLLSLGSSLRPFSSDSWHCTTAVFAK